MQRTRNDIVDMTGDGYGEVAPRRNKRTAIYVYNAGPEVVTIAKGDEAAIDQKGIVLPSNAYWYETNSEGFLAWQGPIQAYGASQLSVSETFEEGASYERVVF